MAGSTLYRVEQLLVDPKTGEALRMNRSGTPYDTLAEAKKEARRGDFGPLWLIVEETVIAVSPEADALSRRQDAAAA